MQFFAVFPDINILYNEGKISFSATASIYRRVFPPKSWVNSKKN